VATRLTVAKKFSLAYFALAALVGGAIGAFVMLVERPAPLPPPPWSVWQPTASDKLVRAQEIGTHIAAQYRLGNGERLVRVVVGSPNATASDPVQGVLLAKKVPAEQSDVLSGIPATDAVMYMLCGTGANCAIDDGRSSPARAAVLRREALELALYTFRYVKNVASVVTFVTLTPPKGKPTNFALYFDKSSFSSQLDHPLHATLGRPPASETLAAAEKKTVDKLTKERVYHFALQRANDARVIVLAPKLG
jgi:hypothetical protein